MRSILSKPLSPPTFRTSTQHERCRIRWIAPSLSTRERSVNSPSEASGILTLSHKISIAEIWVARAARFTVPASRPGSAEARVCPAQPARPYLGVLLAGHGAQARRGHVRAPDGLDLFHPAEFRFGQQLQSNDDLSVIRSSADPRPRAF